MPIDGGGGASAGPDSSATPAPSVSCDFGPFGEQTRVDLKMLEAQKLCKIPLFARFPLPSLTDSAIVTYSQLNSCRKAAPMCSTLARPFGVLTGVLSIQMTDRVRICSFGVGPH